MIYHLLDEAEPFSESRGGAISRWAANMLRDGTETIICPSYDATWGFPENRIYCLPNWECTKYPVHALLYRLPWFAQKWAYLRIFRQLLGKLQPGDILYIHNRPECAGPLSTVAKKHGIHIVLHMHNSLMMKSSRGQLKALETTPIVFCSDFLKKELEEAHPGKFLKTYLVYNGADEDHFHADPEGEERVPTVIFTGRIVPYKGVHILLKAMRLLQHRGVSAQCKIVGGVGFGDKKSSRYLRSVEELRPANTEFVGYLSGKAFASLLRKAHIFCAPSIWDDPFPLAPLEAMASGLPVVASRVGGIPEALVYGGGTLVPPNDPVALADALQPLLEDETRRKELGNMALAAFRSHFVWSHVRQQYASVIEDIAS